MALKQDLILGYPRVTPLNYKPSLRVPGGPGNINELSYCGICWEGLMGMYRGGVYSYIGSLGGASQK